MDNVGKRWFFLEDQVFLVCFYSAMLSIKRCSKQYIFQSASCMVGTPVNATMGRRHATKATKSVPPMPLQSTANNIDRHLSCHCRNGADLVPPQRQFCTIGMGLYRHIRSLLSTPHSIPSWRVDGHFLVASMWPRALLLIPSQKIGTSCK